MLAIFILNVHDLPFSLPLERPPSKQSDQQKCCRGISSLLHIEDFTFLLPSPPHSCSLELEQTYAGSLPDSSACGSIGWNLPSSLQSRTLGVAQKSKVGEMLLPQQKKQPCPQHHSLSFKIHFFFFSEKLDTQAYISKKTVYKFSLSYVHTEGQRNCNLYNRTLVHPMIF